MLSISPCTTVTFRKIRLEGTAMTCVAGPERHDAFAHPEGEAVSHNSA